jgi:hypothetical protein
VPPEVPDDPEDEPPVVPPDEEALPLLELLEDPAAPELPAVVPGFPMPCPVTEVCRQAA